MRGHLTPKFIAGWLPSDKRQYQSDGAIPGFGAYLFPSGKVSFHLMYRDRGGRQHKATLKATEPDAARVEALELLVRIGKGDVPTPQRLLSGGPTLMAVVKGYIAAQGPKYRSGAAFAANFENHLFPVIRPDTPFEHIRRSEVVALLDPIVARGHRHAADTVVKQFNAVARWHSDRVDTYTWKPVPRQLTEDDKAPRERVLSRAEIAELWRASEGDLYGQLLRFVLLTAMRSAEARLLHKRELAPDLSMVTLPPERCKTKITLRLPLSGMAQDIIRPLLRDDSPWVFSFDGLAPISDSGRYMAEFRAKLAPVEQPWTIHDLRRTSATLMEEAGVPPHVIDLGVLHQKRKGISRTYMLHNYTAEKRDAVEALASLLSKIVEGSGSPKEEADLIRGA